MQLLVTVRSTKFPLDKAEEERETSAETKAVTREMQNRTTITGNRPENSILTVRALDKTQTGKVFSNREAEEIASVTSMLSLLPADRPEILLITTGHILVCCLHQTLCHPYTMFPCVFNVTRHLRGSNSRTVAIRSPQFLFPYSCQHPCHSTKQAIRETGHTVQVSGFETMRQGEHIEMLRRGGQCGYFR